MLKLFKYYVIFGGLVGVDFNDFYVFGGDVVVVWVCCF